MKTLLAIGLLLLIPATGQGLEETGVPTILAEVAALTDPGDRVVRLSAAFLGTPYVANTLGGGPGEPEALVSRLDAVDCFTLLDYVEAMRRSLTPGEFRQRLSEVRYRDGRVAWETRRHFFTDWATVADGRLKDVTAQVGGDWARQTDKQLNRKADGSLYLPGVAVSPRTVSFVPSTAVAGDVLDRLRSGDYLGVYTPAPGLDVSHVGIVVRTNGRVVLRHAASRGEAPRVVDSDLVDYLADKPGIVILRPQPDAAP